MALLPQNVTFQFANANITPNQQLKFNLSHMIRQAIGLHLLHNPTCTQHYDDSMFSFLAKGCLPFHFSALEATFIKISNSIHCRHKEFVYYLKLLHVSAVL